MLIKKLLIVLLLIPVAAYCQKDIDNFRNYKWDTPFAQMSEGMTPTKSSTPGFKGYEKANDNLMYEGIQAASIIYLFKNGLFTGVTIAIFKKDVPKALANLKAKYGEPKTTQTPFLNNYEWYLEKSVIVLSEFPTNTSEPAASIGIRKPR
ncbi:MAG TPA: hypothetical protein P5050_05710 [Bacteroidia bacterium]|nr:hypothetical protein [Bacteroidia bacterium]HRS58700.1 hypothetical protein [Bacteroidia bacterium]HRU69341.1 hypothetical protein [Bacteroidia bacterium]